MSLIYGKPTEIAPGSWRFTFYADSDTFGSKVVSGKTEADACEVLEAAIVSGTAFRKIIGVGDRP